MTISFQLIRNATYVINYGGSKFLFDPNLAKKDAYPGFEGTIRSEIRNPMVELPVPVESLLDYDACIVTHTHADHWDDAAMKLLPKEKPIFCQHEKDYESIKSSGFKDVRILDDNSEFNGIKLHRTPCQHGSNELYQDSAMAEIAGQVTGIVLEKQNLKKLYIVADTIWIDKVEQTLIKYQPEVVIINAGYAQVLKYGAIIMGKEDISRIRKVLPKSIIVATHLEAINHCILTRKEIKEYVKENKIDLVEIPNDGDVLQF